MHPPSSHHFSPFLFACAYVPMLIAGGNWIPSLPHAHHFLLQMASEDLIHAAVTNDLHRVASIMKSGAMHVDVCERRGHTPLFAAAVSPTLAM